MAGRLTTTSYCLLGVLRLQPASAYELTKYLKRSALAELWPRTEAAIYRETRRLADNGLATVTTEQEGGRRRSVYRITPDGRSALAEWLAQPAGGLSFECEAAVKAFFGDGADRDTLRRHLEQLVDDVEGLRARMDGATAAWLVGEVTFPDRLHYTAMSADLIARLHLAAGEWAADWLERTEGWDGTAMDDAKRAEAREVIEDLREAAGRSAG